MRRETAGNEMWHKAIGLLRFVRHAETLRYGDLADGVSFPSNS